ncbi:MAG: hypothetical protein PHY93_09135 [Bacteriovorax sp.]|nr:hypothetical protein [Bacteriovorax sp.]
MAIQNFLIMNLLRLITPEEIGDIATKHNGGKFLSLTDLVNERVEHKIYRDFSSPDSMDEIHDAHNQSTQAKILPFKKPMVESEEVLGASEEVSSLSTMAFAGLEAKSESKKPQEEVVGHKDNENMSSFILIEKARLKRSQQILKQKEIIDLYQKNSHIDVEQVKSSNNNLAQALDAGVLVNKKQY